MNEPEANEATQLRLARNPSTPPALLQQLSQDISEEVRRAVTQNPNTPPETLAFLGEVFPLDFFANPSLVLLALENPAFLAELASPYLCRHPEAPLFFLMSALSHPDPAIKTAIAQNPSCPEGLLFALLPDAYYTTQLALARNPRSPASLLTTLPLKERALREALAEHPNTPEELLRLLSQDPTASVRRAVAEHFATPKELRDLLQKDPSPEVALAAQKYPSSLQELLASASVQVRTFGRRSFQQEAPRDTYTLGWPDGYPCYCGDPRCPFGPWYYDGFPDADTQRDEPKEPPTRIKKSAPTKNNLPTEELRAILEKKLTEQEPALQAFITLAGLSSPVTTWREACLTLRHNPDERLEQMLAEGLNTQKLRLSSLWSALSLDDFGPPPDTKGPAVVALRHILNGIPPNRLGKYAWVLTEPAIQDIASIILVQRRLFSIIGTLYQRERTLFLRALNKSPHPLAYWVLVLLKNAEIGALQPKSPEAHTPPWPDPRQWSRAWAQALLLSPGTVAPFFAKAYQLPKPQLSSSFSFVYPEGWRPKEGHLGLRESSI